MKVIGIFKSNCPTGWARFTEMDGKFFRGSTIFGETGGTSNHVHEVDYPSADAIAVSNNVKVKDGVGSPRRYYVLPSHTHTIDLDAGNSEFTDHIPDCIDVVLCYYVEN